MTNARFAKNVTSGRPENVPVTGRSRPHWTVTICDYQPFLIQSMSYDSGNGGGGTWLLVMKILILIVGTDYRPSVDGISICFKGGMSRQFGSI
jgi:hypothetical protein